MNRRNLLTATGLLLSKAAVASASAPLPTSGPEHPAFARVDSAVRQHVGLHRIPGLALAIAHGGRLLFARGYGFADQERRSLCTPRTLFRIGSVSKIVTAIGILRLVDQGRLRLDRSALEVLGTALRLSPTESRDPRTRAITLRMLLQHTSGFSRQLHGTLDQLEIERDLGIPPERQRMVDRVRAGLRLPLETQPGESFEYNNFNYMFAGAVLEQAAGMPMDQFLLKDLNPAAGVQDLRVGRTREKDRFPGEAIYYDAYDLLDKQRFSSVLPESRGQKVPWSYGAFMFESGGGAGELVASMPAVCRVISSLFPGGTRPLLSDPARRMLVAPPPGPLGYKPDGTPQSHYYGLGVKVDWYPGDVVVLHHAGGLPGSSAWFKRWEDGTVAACACNTNNRAQDLALQLVETVRAEATAAVKSPGAPHHDLFAAYL